MSKIRCLSMVFRNYCALGPPDCSRGGKAGAGKGASDIGGVAVLLLLRRARVGGVPLAVRCGEAICPPVVVPPLGPFDPLLARAWCAAAASLSRCARSLICRSSSVSMADTWFSARPTDWNIELSTEGEVLGDTTEPLDWGGEDDEEEEPPPPPPPWEARRSTGRAGSVDALGIARPTTAEEEAVGEEAATGSPGLA